MWTYCNQRIVSQICNKNKTHHVKAETVAKILVFFIVRRLSSRLRTQTRWFSCTEMMRLTILTA